MSQATPPSAPLSPSILERQNALCWVPKNEQPSEPKRQPLLGIRMSLNTISPVPKMARCCLHGTGTNGFRTAQSLGLWTGMTARHTGKMRTTWSTSTAVTTTAVEQSHTVWTPSTLHLTVLSTLGTTKARTAVRSRGKSPPPPLPHHLPRRSARPTAGLHLWVVGSATIRTRTSAPSVTTTDFWQPGPTQSPGNDSADVLCHWRARIERCSPGS